ncbi:MAG: DUF3105 domain-containing protein [Nitriliruptor sp.]
MRRLIAGGLAASLSFLAACSGDATEPVTAPDEDEVAAAEEAAGCEVTVSEEEFDTTHLDPADAPPASELYDERPAVGGPHFGEWLTAGVFDDPVEERAAVHNLERGAVAVHLSPDLDEDQVAAVEAWANARNEAGLLDERSGAGLLVAPWEEPLGPPVAFRAWGVAADCERFDETFADGFVRDHFGPAGVAPEGSFGVDPTEVIGDAAEVV